MQTSNAAPVLRGASPASIGTFAPTSYTVRLPGSATAVNGISATFPTKAAMDAAFPAGEWFFSLGSNPGAPLEVRDLFPAAVPRVLYGSWNVRGQLLVPPGRDYVLTLSEFSEYGAPGVIAADEVRIEAAGSPVVSRSNISTDQPRPNTTISIPASALVAGRTLTAEAQWILVGTTNATAVPGLIGFSTCHYRVAFTISVEDAPTSAPAIVVQPASRTVAPGGTIVLGVVANGQPAPALQWRRGGTALAGATNDQLILTGASAIAGDYSVVATNALGVIASATASVAFDATVNTGRLINLSVLTDIATRGDSFTMGYVVGGTGTAGAKPLVVRAAGPSLGALGVPGVLADPRMELFAGSTRTGENDNWGGAPELAAALAAVGAFAYTGPTSRDAAVATSIASRDNSVRVLAGGDGTGTGRVIAELYDATPGAAFTTTTPRLINVSVLKNLGSGLTAGFVLGGATAKTVLVRAVGPTLGAVPFNVQRVAADPQLRLFAGQSQIASNDNWDGSAALAGVFSSIGAFALPIGSRDAALLITLPPGSYSAQVTVASGAIGAALIEVYEVP
ncbi:MAG: immunoglobulin domain-containing protein [Verrucomicrobia bacterium]|nr:immunoglobulin domain-containing protein [Verrucomicrobiota bacterium]